MLTRVIIVFVFGLTVSWTDGQQTTICQTTFLTQFYNCVQKASLVPQNILWFTKNGTVGTKPAKEAVFKESACKLRIQIYNCTLIVMNKIISSSACADTDKKSITEFFNGVFGTYDVKCAHPCRWTLYDAFKKCHSNIGIVSAPLLLDPTIGSVIGYDKNDTALFCANRGRLMKCMTQEKAKCPDAEIVMRKNGLDLDTMRKSTGVFCNYPKVYLDSVICFEKASPEIHRCHQNAGEKMEDVSSNFQIIINESEFDNQYCTIRHQIESCDLKAWNQSQDEDKCNKAVVGLRIEYGCKLLPDMCKYIFAGHWDTACSSDRFMTSTRLNYGSGAISLTSVSVLWTFGILILLGI